MSRLNSMQDHELAIRSIRNEVAFLEHYLASGQRFGTDELNDLSESVMRLVDIIIKTEQVEKVSWETDNEPEPPWLCSRQRDKKYIVEHAAEKVG